MERQINEAELTMPIQVNAYMNMGESSSEPAGAIFSDSAKKNIDELIKNKIRVVSFFDNIDNYKLSTIGIKYQSINPIDACGYIKSIDYDTNIVTVVIRFDAEDVSMHNGSNSWFNEYCHLIPRGMAQRIHERKADGTAKETLDIVSFVGFDIIKYKEENIIKND